MSLIEKALEKTELPGDGEDRQIYVSHNNHKGLHVKKDLRDKIILWVLLPLLFLIVTGVIIYQNNSRFLEALSLGKSELIAKIPAKTDLVAAEASEAEGAINIVSKPDVRKKELIEKDMSRSIAEKKEDDNNETILTSKIEEKETETSLNEEVPVLVKIENKIESHNSKPAHREEIKPPSEAQHLFAHYNNGVKLEKDGEFMEAAFEYERSIVQNPDHIKSYNNLGSVHHKIGRLDLAAKAYKKALAINPDYVKVHNNLGLVLFQLDKVNEAIDEFKVAISLDSKNVDSYNNLGILYKNMDEIEKARKTFKRALSISPEKAAVHYNLALLYESEDNLKPAFFHYQNFIEFSSSKYNDLKKKVSEHLFILAKKSVLKDKQKNSITKKK